MWYTVAARREAPNPATIRFESGTVPLTEIRPLAGFSIVMLSNIPATIRSLRRDARSALAPEEPRYSFRVLLRKTVVLGLVTFVAVSLGACTGNNGPVPNGATATPVALATSTATAALTDPAPVPSATPTEQAAVALPTSAPTENPSLPLAGHRIGLDPGHGPRRDLGAVLVDPNTHKLILSEDELDLDVAKRCRDILVARGASVTMTRETSDSFTAPWPPDTNGDGIEKGETDDLQERVDILNAAHVEVFLSIHANSASNPALRGGIQALYCATDDCPFADQGKRLGRIVLDHLKSKLESLDVPVKKSELRSDFWPDYAGQPPTHIFMTGPAYGPHHPRGSQMPGITIEALYVTSPDEAAALKRGDVRQGIAVAYADALQEYLTGSK